jgi:hypothetical protein
MTQPAGQHTPGPWTLKPGANDGGLIRAESGSVASVHHRETPGEFEANARLIAQAPAMLAALKRLCDLPLGPGVHLRELKEDAEALLRSVEGG